MPTITLPPAQTGAPAAPFSPTSPAQARDEFAFFDEFLTQFQDDKQDEFKDTVLSTTEQITGNKASPELRAKLSEITQSISFPQEGEQGFVGPVRPREGAPGFVGPVRPEQRIPEAPTPAVPLPERRVPAPESEPPEEVSVSRRFISGVGKGLSKASEVLDPALQFITGREPATTEQLFEGIETSEAGEVTGELIANIPALIAGGAAANTARTAILKIAPSLARGAGVLGALGKSLVGAAEGAVGLAGFEAARELKVPTPEDIKTGAIFGAALPVIGILGAGAKQFLGRFLPESLVKSATKLTKSQKSKIAQRLEDFGEGDVKTAEQFLLKNKIAGTPGEMSTKLLEKSKTARQTKKDVLAGIETKFSEKKLRQFADETIDAVEGVAGLEDEARQIRSIFNNLQAEGATLSQLDELKTLFDRSTNIFKVAGDLKVTAKAKGLGILRGFTKRFIEKEATKAGVKNIRQLNADISLSRLFSDALRAQEIGGAGGAFSRLSDVIVGGTAVTGTLAGLEGGLDFQKVLTAAGVGLVALGAKRVLSPTNKLRFAQSLARRLNEGEAGAILRFLTGESRSIPKATGQKIREAADEVLLLPERAATPAEAIPLPSPGVLQKTEKVFTGQF